MQNETWVFQYYENHRPSGVFYAHDKKQAESLRRQTIDSNGHGYKEITNQENGATGDEEHHPATRSAGGRTGEPLPAV